MRRCRRHRLIATLAKREELLPLTPSAVARIIEQGASGELKTVLPTLSPLIWTSIITGRPPAEHGIVDFF